jgi:hypothetical protein
MSLVEKSGVGRRVSGALEAGGWTSEVGRGVVESGVGSRVSGAVNLASDVGRGVVESGVGSRVSGALEAGRRTSEVGRTVVAGLPAIFGQNRQQAKKSENVQQPVGHLAFLNLDLAPTLLRGSQRRCIPTRSMGTRAVCVGRHVGANSFAIEAGQRPTLPAQEAWV